MTQAQVNAFWYGVSPGRSVEAAKAVLDEHERVAGVLPEREQLLQGFDPEAEQGAYVRD